MKGIYTTVLISISLFIIQNGVALAQDTSHYMYRGVELCASTCHNDGNLGFQYPVWKSSQHSKSYYTLASTKARRIAMNADINGNPQESETCLRCHITAAGMDPSYLTPNYRVEDGVTCEACHKVHWMPKTVIPQETVCLNCHNSSVHKVPKFSFKEKFQIIAHPRPANKTAEE